MSSSGWVGIPGLTALPTRRSTSWSITPTTMTTRPPLFTFGPQYSAGSGIENEVSPTPIPDENKFEPGDTAFILFSTALVFLMIPGLGFFYSGLARTKGALSLIMLCFWSIAVVSVQWFLFGYSLTFSKNAIFFIGNFDNIFLLGVYDAPSIGSDKISELLFCVFQCMFAAITSALVIGAAAERSRFLPTTFFIFIWTTIVYDFIACWTWNPNGWSASLGGLDFAGGTPVHIASGAGALAYALVLGKRKKLYPKEEFKPHNMSYVFLGTALLWFGWFGFNGGSAFSASTQATLALLVTNLSASVGGITWVILDYRLERKYSAVGFCSGAVAGLVCITPGCGFVGPASSIVFGVVGALACNIAVSLKAYTCYDDALDVFAVHGVGGIVGNLLTGVFARKAYAPYIDGGGLDGNWIQILYQLADTAAGFTWSFVITFILLFIMNKIPGLRLRVEPEVERTGVDFSELGFHCYEYVEELRNPSVGYALFGDDMGMGGNNKSSYVALYGQMPPTLPGYQQTPAPKLQPVATHQQMPVPVYQQTPVPTHQQTPVPTHQQMPVPAYQQTPAVGDVQMHTAKVGPATKFDYQSQLLQIYQINSSTTKIIEHESWESNFI